MECDIAVVEILDIRKVPLIPLPAMAFTMAVSSFSASSVIFSAAFPIAIASRGI